MVRKVLMAAFLAAFAVAGGGALGADFYVGGGGGGGGGAADSGSGGGKAGGDGGDAEGATGSPASDATAADGGATGAGAGSGAAGGKGGNTQTANPGNAADGDNGGRGSDGKDLTVDITFSAQTDAVTIQGGDGGIGGGGTTTVGVGGDGGIGGDVTVSSWSGDASTGAIAVKGGTGGNAGATNTTADGKGGGGGNGGNVIVTAGTLTLNTGADLTLTAGDGGDTDTTVMAAPAAGGKGGNVTFNATKVVLNGTTFTAVNGDTGSEGDTLGGNVNVTIGTLAAGATKGTFSTAGGVSGANAGKRSINIGAIEAIAGDMDLNFATFDFSTETMSIGDVTMGDANATAKALRTLTVTGGQLSETNGWNGDLNVFGLAKLDGVSLSNKNVTVDIKNITDIDFATDVFLTTTGGTMDVDAGTKVALKINADQKADLLSGDNDLSIFEDGKAAAIDGEEFKIYNGAEEAVALFNDGGVADVDAAALVFAVDAGKEGAAYNALLAAPATMSLVNGGADVVEKVTSSFSPMAFTNSGMQFGVFADIGAASIDVETGSGVDTDSFHMLIGPGLRINNGTGKTDFGAFFEAGWGSYDAYSGAFNGDGDTEYYGGGLLLRHDTCFGLYGEASVRLGGADMDYANRNGLDTDYSMDSTYFGGHIGLGYILRPTECTSWDFFAKGILTHISGEEALDKAGNTLAVDSADSFRTQMGAKYSYNFAQNASFYVKGAWEHEFDGETGGRYNGTRIAKEDSGGSSVIGELGVDVRVAERVTLGASVYGITGQRDGFGGNLNIGIGF